VIGSLSPAIGSAESPTGPSNAPLPGPAVIRSPQTPTPQTGMAAGSLRIPELSVTAIIGPATIDHGVLTPPRIPMEVGAWAGSAALDATSGAVTLAGHVNWAGMTPFAFARLASLQPGDIVYTTDAKARQTAWRVTAVVARAKSAGIDQAAFTGTSGPRTLWLITCGGPFNSADDSYDDNVYVQAHPVKQA
jgi:sortase (surface protein transpeptidase)